MSTQPKNADEGRNAYSDLMKRTKFTDPNTMLLSTRTVKNAADVDRVNGMLRALSVGDHDGFVAKAESLGVAKDQALLAVRDTAALGALIMQFGSVARW